MFLRDKTKNLAAYKMFLLIEDKYGVSLRLRAQAFHNPTFPTTLL